VIYTATSRGGACDDLLTTLKPGQDATSILKNLLVIRVKDRGTLNETSERLYVSLDELMSTAQKHAKFPASHNQPVSGHGNALF